MTREANLILRFKVLEEYFIVYYPRYKPRLNVYLITFKTFIKFVLTQNSFAAMILLSGHLLYIYIYI